jgi:hypothetical protein
LFFNFVDRVMDLRFTATGAPPARTKFADGSPYLMADNVWNEGR